MKIVLLESLAVSDEVLQKYTRDLEQKRAHLLRVFPL